jgi:tetratricopeptide (TPR) repeat protein
LFERATQADPSNAPAWQAWALLEKELRRYEEARRLFERATQADPNDPVAWQAWALLESQLGRHDEAERLLRQGLRHVRDGYGLGLLHSSLGRLLADRGRLQEAEESFRKALQHNERDAQTHYHFAVRVLLRTNRRTEACQHLCRAKALGAKKQHIREMIERAVQRNGCQCSEAGAQRG